VTISGLQAATMALWVLAGMWLRNISKHTIHTSIMGGKYGKSLYIGIVTISTGYTGDLWAFLWLD